MKSTCPQCGSAELRERFGGQRVCRECGTRFTPSKSLWERFVFSFVFLVPGLLFAVIAGFFVLDAPRWPPRRDDARLALVFGFLALVCFTKGVRELIGRDEKMSQEKDGDSTDEPGEGEELPGVAWPSPLLPPEQAEALVREIAERHRAKRILRSLGNLPQKNLENAVANFAQEMKEDETPLVQLDCSFLSNGKTGLVITNRALYSSFYSRPICLADIDDVSCATPSLADHLAFHFFGGLLYALIVGFRRLQCHLLVNGNTVYSTGNPLRSEFWIELLTELSEAARGMQISVDEENHKPSVVILETALRICDDDFAEMRQLRNPSWHDVERSIRALNQDTHPSLLIWAGEVEQAPALELLGGNGKYVLRELGDGWIYYDPSAGEEEVEICKGPSGHRAPAYYVCTDLRRVLEIARRYFETGTPE